MAQDLPWNIENIWLFMKFHSFMEAKDLSSEVLMAVITQIVVFQGVA
jgi:hypothetical protein